MIRNFRTSFLSKKTTFSHEKLATQTLTPVYQIGLGIESPNPRTLELMNKKNMLGDVERAIELAKKYRIITEGYFIIGHHAETVEDTMAYPEYAKSLGIDKALFMVMTPYPGTKIFDEYKNAGNIVSFDWDLYNNYSPVIRTASMDVHSIVKMMAYCHFAFSSYHSVIRKNGARSILIDLMSRFLTLSLLMKTNKMLSEEEFIDAFYGALAMYSAEKPVIELERDDFMKKIWKSPMIISIEHSAGKTVDITLRQKGTKRTMMFAERERRTHCSECRHQAERACHLCEVSFCRQDQQHPVFR